jgi:hypothetical protein
LSATRGRDEQGDSDDAAVQVERVHRGDGGAGMPSAKNAETRVFTDHRDLLGYLGGELEKE